VEAPRHKRVVDHPFRRGGLRSAAPALLAALVTVAVVGVAVAEPDRGRPATSQAPARLHLRLPAQATGATPHGAARTVTLSRSAKRVTLEAKPPPKVTGHRYMTAPLNLWTKPSDHSTLLEVVPSGTRVAVTGVVRHGYAEVALGGHLRWVTAIYLSQTKPAPATASSASTSGPSTGSVVSTAPCASGSSVESGIVANAVTLHRSVCAHFPQVTTYGGYRPDGEHADGHAIDAMVYADSGLGQAIADWLRANASALHVQEVIWAQHIWTVERSAEGWRLMPDRGSVTANHYDHVHVRVY
jgi:hypothetical protein